VLAAVLAVMYTRRGAGVPRRPAAVAVGWAALLILGELLCWGVFGIYQSDPRRSRPLPYLNGTVTGPG